MKHLARIILLGLGLGLLTISNPAWGQTRTSHRNRTPVQPPAPESVSTIMTVNAPTDEIEVNYSKIYLIRVFPNFVANVELPEAPDAIIVGNTARFQVDSFRTLGAGVGNGAGVSGSNAERTILVKPLKANPEKDDDPIESSLTVRLASGKVMSFLLRNARRNDENVFSCSFRDATLPNVKTEAVPAGPPARIPEKTQEEKDRETIAGLLERTQAVAASDSFNSINQTKTKEAVLALQVEAEGRFLLALVKIAPTVRNKTLQLTTPSWKLGEEDLQPRIESQPLPASITGQAFVGRYVFEVAGDGANAPDSTRLLTVSLGIRGKVVQVSAKVVTQAPKAPVAPQAQSGKDQLTRQQQQEIEVLKQITGVKTATTAKPAESESTAKVSSQERLHHLVQVTNVRSEKVMQRKTRLVTAGMYLETVGNDTLVLLLLERNLGSDRLEIGVPQLTLNGKPANPGLIVQPFPAALTTQPLVSGFLFSNLQVAGTQALCAWKIGKEALVLQPPAPTPATGSGSALSKVLPTGQPAAEASQTQEEVKWTRLEVNLKNNQCKMVVEGLNQSTSVLEEIEAFWTTTGTGSEPAETHRAQSTPNVFGPKTRLNPGEKCKFTFVFQVGPGQSPIEIRWKANGEFQSRKINLF
ncbi:MAG: hypothetical protein K1Y36_05295 [Blastocatellia bacterium]|nr:hypothetical protein [Blastocatellia bacterium]